MRAFGTQEGSHERSLLAISVAGLALSLSTPAHAADVATARPNQPSRQDEGTRPSDTLLGGKFLVGWPLVDLEPAAALLAAGFDARIDSPTHFVETGFGALASIGSALYYALYSELGASVYLRQRSTAPYVGVGAIGRFAASYWSGGPQLLVYGQAGVAFDRGRTTQYFADIRVAPSLTAIDVSRVPDAHDRPGPIRPIEIGLQLGFGW